MADGNSKLPVENEDVQAGILAAFARIESVPVSRNLIDEMSDEEWHSDGPDSWNIEAGSDNGADEVDELDAEIVHAA
ncbi:hypothetical protein [Mameliella sp.]|uniref:hypothetical protein n=1 Tax=Mameliella sp. TaxID=1924940 RepID=UPI003BAC7C5D